MAKAPGLRVVASPKGGVARVERALPAVFENEWLRVEANDAVRRTADAEGERFVAGDAARMLAVRCQRDGDCHLALDTLGARDVYYERNGDTWTFATSVGLLPRRARQFDQAALAHALTVYGFRPPKRHTWFEGVQRLGVNQSVQVDKQGVHVTATPFEPVPIGAYGDAELDTYADLLLEAVRTRAAATGNVVYLSSGWDSTALLACLVHLLGSGAVTAVIGRMYYAGRSGLVNQFEVDRARKMAAFYGVTLHEVDFDYRTNGSATRDRVAGLFRDHHFASIPGMNHSTLAAYTAQQGLGDVVFAGEMSDGAHNFGFSQYATYFHPKVEFREYFDKMGTYLYSPTFFELFQSGAYERDPAYGAMRQLAGDVAFDEAAAPGVPRAAQLLGSLYMRTSRIPLWSLRNQRMLTAAGRDRLTNEIERSYLGDAATRVTGDTLYSWYLHLYNSFHWQGSTVATIAASADANGLRAALPFHDVALQRFLGSMPETWGRGLDLNPTKYPLKWMLTHRVKYPMHLQTGPHSYIYDVNPSFSHAAEILHGSALGDVFREQLGNGWHERHLSPHVFDLDYINGLVRRYVAREEVAGRERTDLMALALLSAFATPDA